MGHVGVVINRNIPFTYSITFDSTNSDGKVYAGYEIVAKDSAGDPIITSGVATWTINNGNPIVNINDTGSLNISLIFLLVNIDILDIESHIHFTSSNNMYKRIFNISFISYFE